MTLRLTSLGGAAAWPNPGQGCSAFLLRSVKGEILLDAGANTLLELRKHTSYSSLSAIVISHCHADHILDLVPFRYGLTYGKEKPEKPIPLWLPPGGIARLNALASAIAGPGESGDGFWDQVFALEEYDPDDVLTVAETPIRFQRTEHAVECYAMRVESPAGRVLTYTADTGSIKPLLDLARGSHVLVCEGTLPEDDEGDSSAGHLKPSEAGALATGANVRTLVVSHLWSERPDEDVINAAATTFGGEIFIAKPGLVIDV